MARPVVGPENHSLALRARIVFDRDYNILLRRRYPAREFEKDLHNFNSIASICSLIVIAIRVGRPVYRCNAAPCGTSRGDTE